MNSVDLTAPIAVQGAMDSETEALRQALSGRKDTVLNGYRLSEGTVDGIPVLVVQTRIGMVNAAASTASVVSALRPLCVLNQGTAGGHGDGLHTGDIVIAEKACNINYFQSNPRGRGAGMNAAAWTFLDPEVETDGEWSAARYRSCFAPLVDLAASVPYTGGRLIRGVIGSGDSWNREVDRILLLRRTFGTACEEMETFAAAQVCRQAGVPFLGFRVIANHELYGEEFDESTGLLCQRYALDVIRQIAVRREELFGG